MAHSGDNLWALLDTLEREAQRPQTHPWAGHSLGPLDTPFSGTLSRTLPGHFRREGAERDSRSMGGVLLHFEVAI